MNRLKEAAVFSIIDLKAGYWQIPIREGDQWKTAFITPDGLYEWIVMPFGLKNAPATFQAYMSRVIDKKFEDYTAVYLDDILIFSPDIETHTRHLTAVLQRLSEFNLIVKAEKCSFAAKKIKYLGYIVSKGKVEMDPAKVKVISDYPTPTSHEADEEILGDGELPSGVLEGHLHL